MGYFSRILTFVLFVIIGMVISKNTLKKNNKYYNLVLFVLIIISSFVGINTSLVKIFDFKIILSIVLPSIFFGILIGRLNSKYSLIKNMYRPKTVK